jgi:hypothetical protein
VAPHHVAGSSPGRTWDGGRGSSAAAVAVAGWCAGGPRSTVDGSAATEADPLEDSESEQYQEQGDHLRYARLSPPAQ